MDSSPKPAKPDPGKLVQPPPTDGNATIRTPEGDVTIRRPGEAHADNANESVRNKPKTLRAWDATVRMTDTEATIRMTKQRPSLMDAAAALWSRLAKPVLAAASFTLIVVLAAYVYFLNSKVDLEIANRQQALAALDQAATAAVAMRQELTQARKELDESKQRLIGMAALQDLVAQREADLERLNAQLGEKEQELVALYRKASPKDETLAMLRSASIHTIPLSGLDDAKSAGGLILYDSARGRAFLYAFNLSPLPRGKVYQLWVGPTKPVSAGTFKADTGRKGRLLVRNLPARSGSTKFTVSVEPEGGRPQPTGAMVLRGSF